MPVFFGSVLFLLLALVAIVIGTIVFAPSGPILLVLSAVLYVLGRRATSRLPDEQPPGPQARWREEAAAANE